MFDKCFLHECGKIKELSLDAETATDGATHLLYTISIPHRKQAEQNGLNLYELDASPS